MHKAYKTVLTMKAKKSNLFILFCLFWIVTVSAQKTVYLEYDNACMKRLEYKVTENNNTTNEVNYQATSGTTTLVFKTDKGKRLRFGTKPLNYQTCSSTRYDEAFMQRMNTGEIEVYVLYHDNGTYYGDYINEAALIKDKGHSISYQSFTDGFEYSSGDFINPTANLSTGVGMNQLVMYRGHTGLECFTLHTFRQSTINTCGAHTDVTFQKDLGVVQTTTYENKQFVQGANPVIKSSQLIYINSLPVDNYLDAYCNGQNLTDQRYEFSSGTYTLVASANTNEFKPKGTTVVSSPAKVTTTVTTTTSAKPVIAPVRKLTPKVKKVQPKTSKPALRPSIAKTKRSKTKPVVASKPKAKLKKRTMTDFTNGIPAPASTYGEPTAPVKVTKAKVKVQKAKPQKATVAKVQKKKKTVVKKAVCSIKKRPGYHVVRAKESLFSISRMTGVSVTNLVKWNNISDDDIIHTCDELRLTAPKTVAKVAKKVPVEFSNKGEEKVVKNINKKPSDIEGIHIVREGENIYNLAKLYGYTVERFKKMNGLNTDIISPKMVLKTTDCACAIPEDFAPVSTSKGIDELPQIYEQIAKSVSADQELYHVLKEGDTLYKIANLYQVAIEKIKLLNGIKNPTELSVGQKLRIR